MCSFANGFSQKDRRDTIWFDKNWEKTEKMQAVFYRVYEEAGNLRYIVYDRFLNGMLQMKAEAYKIYPLLKDGLALYYDEDGNVTRKTNYKDNIKNGTEVIYFDAGMDSTVNNHIKNDKGGYSTECIRKSPRDMQGSMVGNPYPLAEAYTVVENMPEYPGGLSALMNYLQENLKYPSVARKKGWDGKVYVKFVVDIDGSIRNVEVIRSSGTAMLDEEAIRVVTTFQKWKPGVQDGKPVPVYFNLPINFHLTNNYGSKKPITDEEYSVFYYNLGVEYDNATKYDFAIACYTKSLAFKKNDIDSLYNLGVSYNKFALSDKACETWKKIKEMGKSDADELLKKYCNN